MTLTGLMKHLASVEDDRFGRWLHNEPRRERRASVDWAAEPDWESAKADTPEAVRTRWQESIARARTAAEKAFTVGGLDCKTRRSRPDSRSPSLRWLVPHMIEGYARHNGYADLLRESIDGRVGE